MTNRLHRSFTSADGLHAVTAWDVETVVGLEVSAADVGKVARVVRPGGAEYVSGVVELYAAGGPSVRAPRDVITPGSTIYLYPFAADGAQPFTVDELVDEAPDALPLRLHVTAQETGEIQTCFAGENELGGSPRPAGFSSVVYVQGDGITFGSSRYLLLHDVADGGAVWRELVLRDPDAAPEAPGGAGGLTVEQHAALGYGDLHGVIRWYVGDVGALVELGATAEDVGKVALVGTTALYLLAAVEPYKWLRLTDDVSGGAKVDGWEVIADLDFVNMATGALLSTTGLVSFGGVAFRTRSKSQFGCSMTMQVVSGVGLVLTTTTSGGTSADMSYGTASGGPFALCAEMERIDTYDPTKQLLLTMEAEPDPASTDNSHRIGVGCHQSSEGPLGYFGVGDQMSDALRPQMAVSAYQYNGAPRVSADVSNAGTTYSIRNGGTGWWLQTPVAIYGTEPRNYQTALLREAPSIGRFLIGPANEGTRRLAELYNWNAWSGAHSEWSQPLLAGMYVAQASGKTCKSRIRRLRFLQR
jgi:hypothetical protein